VAKWTTCSPPPTTWPGKPRSIPSVSTWAATAPAAHSQQGNLRALQEMARTSSNPLAHFHPVRGTTHFNILAPTTRLIAAKILKDTGPATNIAFTEEELNRPFAR